MSNACHHQPAKSNLGNIKPKKTGLVHCDNRLNQKLFKRSELASQYIFGKAYRSP
jgi:hypothetical protein